MIQLSREELRTGDCYCQTDCPDVCLATAWSFLRPPFLHYFHWVRKLRLVMDEFLSFSFFTFHQRSDHCKALKGWVLEALIPFDGSLFIDNIVCWQEIQEHRREVENRTTREIRTAVENTYHRQTTGSPCHREPFECAIAWGWQVKSAIIPALSSSALPANTRKL